jgi:hypothetical protein
VVEEPVLNPAKVSAALLQAARIVFGEDAVEQSIEGGMVIGPEVEAVSINLSQEALEESLKDKQEQDRMLQAA